MVTPRNIRLVLALIVVTAAVGITVAVVVRRTAAPQPEPASQLLPRNIDVALSNARFTEVRDGVTAWEMVAGRAEYDKRGDVAFLSDIRMVYAQSRTNGSITVTAARGEYAAAQRDIRLRGAVHAVSESGITFTTESLDYQAAQSRFTTADRVNFSHERLSLAAAGMELDARAETSRFRGPIEAVVAGLQQK